MPTTHNHMTRDIRPQGECPACDIYWSKYPPKKGGTVTSNQGEPKTAPKKRGPAKKNVSG